MSLDYSTLLSSIKNLCVDDGSTDFTAIFPQAIAYCENRAYRELDMLSDRVDPSPTVTLSAGSRNATCPASIQVVEGINLLTPVGQVPPTASRSNLERMSLDFIDIAYGSESTTGTPTVFAMKTDTTIILAPTPASAWKIEIVGTGQAAPMSPTNTTSPLGNYFPDLLLSGVMIFMSAWQRDVGGQMNPGDADTWSSAFKMQMQSAIEFIQRQKSQDPGWNPLTPTPLATPRT